MSKYYCHIPKGLDCTCRTENGKCEGTWSGAKDCKYRGLTLPYTPPPSVKKTGDSNCSYCEHNKVCSLQEKYTKALREMYPAVAPCKHFKQYNVFQLPTI